MLLDTGAVLAWLRDNGHRFGIDPENHSRKVWILAAAECATEVGENPGGLFTFLVKQIARGDFSKLSDDRYDRAKRRLRDFGFQHSVGDDEPSKLENLINQLLGAKSA